MMPLCSISLRLWLDMIALKNENEALRVAYLRSFAIHNQTCGVCRRGWN